MSSERERPDGGDPAAAPTAPVYLSVIMPAYNEERRLRRSLPIVLRHLGTQPYAWEVLVVENGSEDRTLEVACSFQRDEPRVRAMQVNRRGKGLAVRRGMLEARGEFRFMCDVDLSMPIEQIERFLPPRLVDFDIAIGSRELPGSVVHDPGHRRMIGRAFNRLTRRLLVPGLRDTQCGFKCFRAAAAEAVFSRLRLEGLSFDVEALFLARRLGQRIVEVPITWTADRDSRVSMARDSFRMVRDLLAVRRHARRGEYDRPAERMP